MAVENLTSDVPKTTNNLPWKQFGKKREPPKSALIAFRVDQKATQNLSISNPDQSQFQFR